MIKERKGEARQGSIELPVMLLSPAGQVQGYVTTVLLSLTLSTNKLYEVKWKNMCQTQLRRHNYRNSL